MKKCCITIVLNVVLIFILFYSIAIAVSGITLYEYTITGAANAATYARYELLDENEDGSLVYSVTLSNPTTGSYYINTYNIAESGTITLIDEWSGGSSGFRLASNTVYVEGSSPKIRAVAAHIISGINYFFIDTVQLSDDGSISTPSGTPIDRLNTQFYGNYPCMFYIPGSSDLYAVFYGDGTDINYRFIDIASDGDIGSALSAPTVVGTGGLNRPHIAHIVGNTWLSVFSSSSGFYATVFSIDPSDGSISITDTTQLDGSEFYNGSGSDPICINDIGTYPYTFLVTRTGLDTDQFITTFNIESDGSATLIDQYEAGQFYGNFSSLSRIQGNYYMDTWYYSVANQLMAQTLYVPTNGNLDTGTIVNSDWLIATNSYLGADVQNPFPDNAINLLMASGKMYVAQSYCPPSLTTDSYSVLSETSANVYGTIEEFGTSDVTVRGFCWGTTANPTISGSHSSSTYIDLNQYHYTITNISQGVRYYVRSYATSEDGTGYGNGLSFFTTPPYNVYEMKFIFNANHISGSPTFTISDQSGNGHNGSYILAPNPSNISGSIGSLIAISGDTDASYLLTDESSLSWGAPDEPENMYEEQDLDDRLGYPGNAAKEIAESWGISVALIWAITATVVLVIIGMAITGAVHSPFFTALVVGGCVFIGYEMGIYTGWIAMLYPYMALGVVVSRKFY